MNMPFTMPILWVFFAATVLSSGLTHLLVRGSAHFRLVAAPRSDRWHTQITPNTGGLAISMAFGVCYVFFALGQQAVIAAGGAAMALLGFIDDRVQLSPVVKLAGQFAVSAAVAAGGVVFHASPWEWINLVITLLWIVGITNAFNLIDNMDGLCAGVGAIICGSRFLLAIEAADSSSVLLLAILGGSILGFLFFNHHPAKIFMGDCGSMFIGFYLASLTIAAQIPNTRVFVSTIFYPTLPFLYPIFDTLLVSVLRRCAGRPISVGGRDHSSHRLVSLGLTEKRAVWLLWVLAALGSGSGLLTYTMPVGIVAIAVVLIIGVSVFGAFLASLPAYTIPDTAPVRAHSIRKFIPHLRAGVTLSIDTLLAGVALLTAFLVRWEGIFIGPPVARFLVFLPVIMASYVMASLMSRSFDSGWRWLGARDLYALTLSAVGGSAVAVFVLWLLGTQNVSRGVIILYTLLVLLLTGGLRLSMRLLWHSLSVRAGERRGVVLGTGGAAAIAVLVLQQNHSLNTNPVAVIDTDPASDRLRIHGVAVHYVGMNGAELVRRTGADLLIIPASVRLTPKERVVVEQCRDAGISIEQFDMGLHHWQDQAVTA